MRHLHLIAIALLLCSCVQNLQQKRFFRLLEQQSAALHEQLIAEKPQLETDIAAAISEEMPTEEITAITYWHEGTGSFDHRVYNEKTDSFDTAGLVRTAERERLYFARIGLREGHLTIIKFELSR